MPFDGRTNKALHLSYTHHPARRFDNTRSASSQSRPNTKGYVERRTFRLAHRPRRHRRRSFGDTGHQRDNHRSRASTCRRPHLRARSSCRCSSSRPPDRKRCTHPDRALSRLPVTKGALRRHSSSHSRPGRPRRSQAPSSQAKPYRPGTAITGHRQRRRGAPRARANGSRNPAPWVSYQQGEMRTRGARPHPPRRATPRPLPRRSWCRHSSGSGSRRGRARLGRPGWP